MIQRFSEAELVLEIGHVAMARGLVDDALRIMDGLIVIEPGLPHPRIGRALSLFLLGQRQLAIESMRETVEIFPDAVFARSMLAWFLKQEGDPMAVEVARSVLERNPPDFVAAIAHEVLGNGRAFGGGESSEVSAESPASSALRKPGERQATFPLGFRGTRV